MISAENLCCIIKKLKSKKIKYIFIYIFNKDVKLFDLYKSIQKYSFVSLFNLGISNFL